jgi:FkbM family methyltransferase
VLRDADRTGGRPPGPAVALVYRALCRSAAARRYPWGERAWDKAWGALAAYSGEVTIPLHGTRAKVDLGYPYPALIAQFPTYNSPLVAAARAVAADRRGPVDVIDVGAAVGDTVLLLAARLGPLLGRALCLDGDPAFVRQCRANLAGLPGAEVIECLLGDEGGEGRELVRHHSGTASALGTGRVPTVTLDEVAARWLREGPPGVLKTDVDGLDGTVLAGARGVLASRPVVAFEWHPLLCQRAGTDPLLPFDVLAQAGYDRYCWFDKTGAAAGPVAASAADARVKAVELLPWCLDRAELDRHFDVVALPPDGPGLDALRAEHRAAVG